jgi:hypothetical protein
MFQEQGNKEFKEPDYSYSNSLVMTAAKSLKKTSSSLAYLSTYCLKDLSDTSAISVGNIIKDLKVLSSYY